METSCREHQHGARKPLETSGVYFGFIKTFFLSAKNIGKDTSLNILVIANEQAERRRGAWEAANLMPTHDAHNARDY